MVHLGDIQQINGAEIEPVWCVVGGSPCQDLSTAGLKGGIRHASRGDDTTTRSGLFLEQIRIVREMRSVQRYVRGTNQPIRYPRYMVWENVDGARASNAGADFAAVLEECIHLADPNASVPQLTQLSNTK